MVKMDLGTLQFDEQIEREWLVSNGIGGYASSTIPGLNTRKYHGLLVAALAPPVRRMVLLSRVEETVMIDGWPRRLASSEYPGTIHPEGWRLLRAFGAEPFPRWAYQTDDFTIEKSLCLLRWENTVCLSYCLLGGKRPVEFELRPLFALRGIHELMYQWNGKLQAEARGAREGGWGRLHRIPPTTRTPEVFFAHDGSFTAESAWYLNTIYRAEEERGYAGLEDLWNAGVVRWTLSPGQSVHFVCSTDPVELERVVGEAERLSGEPTAATRGVWGTSLRTQEHPANVQPDDQDVCALLRAAEQFVLSVPRESENSGQEKATAVMTDYPWAPPSGRNALIAFAGLFLAPGRLAEGRELLQGMLDMMVRGLMPSEFPEDGSAPLYHGAGTSLWFAHAAQQYLWRNGEDVAFARRVLEALRQMIGQYRQGTELGIRADDDGLLRSADPRVGTTWMDAQVNDWIATPRRGRPVELNALWHNAVCIAAELAERAGDRHLAHDMRSLAGRIHTSFNARFWNEAEHCCFDVVQDDGADGSVRPNQLFAVSLPYPVLAIQRHASVVEKVRSELLTPMGVRTLSQKDVKYHGRYLGDVLARDAAYHQGSAYPWLMGPFAAAYCRVYGHNDRTRQQVREWLEPLLQFLRTDGMGQLPELFDGDAPQRPGGAVASARSVAGVLCALTENWPGTEPDCLPPAAAPKEVVRR